MAEVAPSHAPASVLRRIQRARAMLVNAAYRRAIIGALPFAGLAAVAVAIIWYLAAGFLGAIPAFVAPTAIGGVFTSVLGAVLLRCRRRLPTLLAAAVELDDAARTHSLLASSLEFASGHRGPFEQWTERLAAHQAERGDLAMPQPSPVPHARARMLVGVALLALAVLSVSVISPRNWSTPGSLVPSVAFEQSEIDEAVASVEEARVEVAQAAEDLGLTSDHQFFEELEAELEQGLLDPDEAVASAATQLDELAAEAETEAERAQDTRDAVAERLAEVNPEEMGEAQQLAESLAEGDFSRAAEEANDLGSRLDDPGVRESLERLADQIEQSAESTANESIDPIDEELRDIAEQLREQANQQSPEPTPPPSPRDTQDEPQSSENPGDQTGRSGPEQQTEQDQPQQDQPQQDQPQQDQSQRDQSQEGPDQQPQSSSDSPASETSSQPTESPQQQSEPTQREGRETQQPSDSQSEQQSESQTSQSDQPGQPSDAQQSESQPTDSQQNEASEQQSDQQGEQQAEPGNEPSPTGSPTPASEPPPDQASDSQSSADPSDSGPPAPSTGEQGQQNPTAPGEQQTPIQGEGEGTPSANPNQTPSTQPSTTPGQSDRTEPATLERLAEEQQRAQELRQFADSMRNRSDQLLGNTPDEPGPEITPETPGSTNPWAGNTDLVDARQQPDEELQERVVSEWFRNPEGRPVESGTPGDASRVIERAAREAERAIEQQTVPKRHEDLIRRVFERYANRANNESEPARDAEPTDASDADTD